MPLNPTSTLATATAIQTIRLFTAPYQRATAYNEHHAEAIRHDDSRSTAWSSDQKKRRDWQKRPVEAFANGGPHVDDLILAFRENQEFIKHRVASANRASYELASYVHTRSSLAFTKRSCVTTRLCGRACSSSPCRCPGNRSLNLVRLPTVVSRTRGLSRASGGYAAARDCRTDRGRGRTRDGARRGGARCGGACTERSSSPDTCWWRHIYRCEQRKRHE